MSSHDYQCGGCTNLGRHKRWCKEAVGPRAAKLGIAAQRAEDLGDFIGHLDPASANLVYGASRRLLSEATRAAHAFETISQWEKPSDG